jgi:molybdate transport system substrate-binding protein
VKLVVAKVALGEADAGIVYRTDVRPAAKHVSQSALPRAAQPTVKYELCIPTARKHPQLAARFVREVLSTRGRAALKAAGFGLP